LDRRDLGLGLFAVVVLMLVGAPCAKDAVGELEALLAEGLLLAEPSEWRRRSRSRCDRHTCRRSGIQVLKAAPTI